MYYILHREFIRDLEHFTVKKKNISFYDLMNVAASVFTQEFIKDIDTTCPILVVVGAGNNGGDGLVIAKNLLQLGYDVNILMTHKNMGGIKEQLQGCLDEILDIAKTTNIFIKNMKSFRKLLKTDNAVIIDALYGIGLNREVSGISKTIIEHINKSNNKVYSVDTPSGININSLEANNTIIQSTKTFTFQTAKMNFLLENFSPYVPNFKVLDIGLASKGWDKRDQVNHFYINKKSVKKYLKDKGKFIYKYKNGQLLLIAGSYGKIGAAILSGLGALRTGVGLLTTHIPIIGYSPAQAILIGSLFDISKSKNYVSFSSDNKHYQTIVFGPGVGINEYSRNTLHYLLKKLNTPLVIDADAINLIAESKNLLSSIPPNSVFTPHSKEFERLVGKWRDETEKYEKLTLLSSYTKSVVVLKGAHTCIAEPSGKCYFNSTGNNGMATAGMGDVLAGMIGSFMAQGYSSLEASIIGVYTHGLAGDICAKNIGQEGYTAEDVANNVPKALDEIKAYEHKKNIIESVIEYIKDENKAKNDISDESEGQSDDKNMAQNEHGVIDNIATENNDKPSESVLDNQGEVNNDRREETYIEMKDDDYYD